MMCKPNHWASDATVIGFQVLVNFAFLIVFVFTYGKYIGKKEMTHQINGIVDDVLTSVSAEDFATLTGGANSSQINTAITRLQKSINNKSTEAVDAMKKNNKDVWKKSFLLYCMIGGAVIAIMLVLRFGFGYCLGVKYAVIKAIVATVFIALTEVAIVNVNLMFIPFSQSAVKKIVGDTMSSFAKSQSS